MTCISEMVNRILGDEHSRNNGIDIIHLNFLQ